MATQLDTQIQINFRWDVQMATHLDTQFQIWTHMNITTGCQDYQFFTVISQSINIISFTLYVINNFGHPGSYPGRFNTLIRII